MLGVSQPVRPPHVLPVTLPVLPHKQPGGQVWERQTEWQAGERENIRWDIWPQKTVIITCWGIKQTHYHIDRFQTWDSVYRWFITHILFGLLSPENSSFIATVYKLDYIICLFHSILVSGSISVGSKSVLQQLEVTVSYILKTVKTSTSCV